MNALRQFITSTNKDTIIVNIPPEYRDQKLEIIVLPISDGKESYNKMLKLMDKISDKAKKNGLTKKKLEELLSA